MELVTVLDVPTKDRRVTPPRSTQIDDRPWELLGLVAALLGNSRAGLLRDLALWFIRWPGAKLPKRPSEAEIAQLRGALAVDPSD